MRYPKTILCTHCKSNLQALLTYDGHTFLSGLFDCAAEKPKIIPHPSHYVSLSEWLLSEPLRLTWSRLPPAPIWAMLSLWMELYLETKLQAPFHCA